MIHRFGHRGWLLGVLVVGAALAVAIVAGFAGTGDNGKPDEDAPSAVGSIRTGSSEGTTVTVGDEGGLSISVGEDRRAVPEKKEPAEEKGAHSSVELGPSEDATIYIDDKTGTLKVGGLTLSVIPDEAESGANQSPAPEGDAVAAIEKGSGEATLNVEGNKAEVTYADGGGFSMTTESHLYVINRDGTVTDDEGKTAEMPDWIRGYVDKYPELMPK